MPTYLTAVEETVKKRATAESNVTVISKILMALGTLCLELSNGLENDHRLDTSEIVSAVIKTFSAITTGGK